MLALPPVGPQGGSPGGGADQRQQGTPGVLLFVGGLYVVLSGMVFLTEVGTEALLLWTATAGVGLLLVGGSLAMRHKDWQPRHVEPFTTALVAAVLVHAFLFLWVTEDPGQAPYLLMLLVGAGYLLPTVRSLVIVDAVAVAGWLLVGQALDLPVAGEGDGQPGNILFVGIVLGAVVHFLRRRNAARWASVQRHAEGSIEASEARFRSLAETARDTILLLDAEGRLTYVNPAGFQLFGLKPSDIGRPFGHLLGEAGNDPALLVGTREVTAQRKDGQRFPAELSLARSVRDGGDVAYTGILRDITERKRAAAATQAAAAQDAELETLRQMNSFKTKFLNMAAHELNTPLTPLRLQLHLLKAEAMGSLNDKQGKAVALLDRNVSRLSSLVGEILEVARMQSGRVRLTPTVVEIDAVVDEVVESFNETARRVGVGLAFEGTPGLTAFADRNRCTQILFNLVSNALKFTPSGGSVTVGAGAAGGLVNIEVRDTGLGLTQEQMGRLFQPFSQVHDPMAVTAAGTGLGLYICKGLIEAMGGELRVASPGPGRGSTFSFTLPASPAGMPAPTTAAAAPALGEEDPMVRRLRELI